MKNNAITVTVTVNAPVADVWKYWNEAEHIARWNQPGEGWQTIKAENDLREGGSFLYAMRVIDGSDGFDFTGVYDTIKPFELVSYTLTDGRQSVITFTPVDAGTAITETFDPVGHVPEKDQEAFCLGVLQTFKAYAEELDA